MNLREAIEEYVNAVSSQDYYDRVNQRQVAETIRESRHDLDVLLAVAEAAIAYAEYQASNPGEDFASNDIRAGEYFREQCELWDAFMAARDKVKEVES